jgi:HEAT repeat protein
VRRLLYLLQEEGGKQRDQTVATLALMGPKVLAALLERLKTSEHMTERLRLIRVIEKMGEAALPTIVEQIQQRPGPWYYLRNLIVILGKIGNESQIAVLAPLLRAPDERIQKEVLNAMARIGGGTVDRVLLPFFSEAGDDLRLRIVELWGSMHSEGAVDPLVALLEDRPLVTTKARAELEEKICTALGKIGTPLAMAALTQVAQRKGLLKSYPARVVAAAQNALAAHSD